MVNMIHEYALEPTLLNNWKDFRYLVEKFGVSQGRLISRYPKRWKKQVYESLTGCGIIERKRIEQSLVDIDRRMIARTGDWDSKLNWLSNAEIEHTKRPFHAIVAKDNPRNQDFVLEAESLSDSNPLWNIPRCQIIPRTALAIAECTRTLLWASQEIMFVDPHFAPDKLQYRRPLESILELVVIGPKGPPRNVEIHLSDNWAHDHFERECKKWLPSVIPNSISIKILRWREIINGEKLHNRFILSNIGGVRFGIGLDEGEPGQSDEVELLDEGVVRTRWSQYCVATSAFDFVDETIITGTKSVQGSY